MWDFQNNGQNKMKPITKTDTSLNKCNPDSFFKDKIEDAKEFFKKHGVPDNFKKSTHKRIKAA